jgi:hypothetical protein
VCTPSFSGPLGAQSKVPGHIAHRLRVPTGIKLNRECESANILKGRRPRSPRKLTPPEDPDDRTTFLEGRAHHQSAAVTFWVRECKDALSFPVYRPMLGQLRRMTYCRHIREWR